MRFGCRVCIAVMLSARPVFAQTYPYVDRPPSPVPPAHPPDAPVVAVVTGCLTQPPRSSVYLLERARGQGTDVAGGSTRFVVNVDSVDGGVALRTQLNFEVTIVGLAEAGRNVMRSPDPVAPVPEEYGDQVRHVNLPRLTARSVARVGDRCESTE